MLKYDKQWTDLSLGDVPTKIVAWYGAAIAHSIKRNSDGRIMIIFEHNAHIWILSNCGWYKETMRLSSDAVKRLKRA